MNIVKQKILTAKGHIAIRVCTPEEERTEKLAILCPGYLDTKDYSHMVEAILHN